MQRYAKPRASLYVILSLTVTVLLTLCWASVAQAQQAAPPADEQYGNPAAAVGPTVGGAAPEAGDAGAVSGGGVVSVLPDTGGPLVFLLILGALALLGAGMLLMRKKTLQR